MPRWTDSTGSSATSSTWVASRPAPCAPCGDRPRSRRWSSPRWPTSVFAATPSSSRVDETAPLVDVDGALLERALANVLANAVAVQPPGRPVRVEAGAAGGLDDARVHLRVVDEGPGLPEQDRTRVFEPFQRLGDRSTQAGVGLGLAIAHGFTRANGGRLELDDTPGGGLTVVFDLPVADPDRSADLT